MPNFQFFLSRPGIVNTLLFTLMIIMVTSGCAGSEDTLMPADDDPSVITTASGLRFQDLEMGGGEPATEGDTVIVHYTGWLTDGTKFDSSVDRDQPFSFTIGEGKVIQGWEEGVAGMRIGGIRKLIIPPELAYGDRVIGNGLIPANSTLIFEVELLEIP